MAQEHCQRTANRPQARRIRSARARALARSTFTSEANRSAAREQARDKLARRNMANIKGGVEEKGDGGLFCHCWCECELSSSLTRWSRESPVVNFQRGNGSDSPVLARTTNLLSLFELTDTINSPWRTCVASDHVTRAHLTPTINK